MTSRNFSDLLSELDDMLDCPDPTTETSPEISRGARKPPRRETVEKRPTQSFGAGSRYEAPVVQAQPRTSRGHAQGPRFSERNDGARSGKKDTAHSENTGSTSLDALLQFTGAEPPPRSAPRVKSRRRSEERPRKTSSRGSRRDDSSRGSRRDDSGREFGSGTEKWGAFGERTDWNASSKDQECEDEHRRNKAASQRKSRGTVPMTGRSSGSSGVMIGGTAHDEDWRIKKELICLKCDFTVLRFARARWSQSADYMFFRNYMPNKRKMKEQLRRSREHAAYACQCTWQSVRELKPIATKTPAADCGGTADGQDVRWIGAE